MRFGDVALLPTLPSRFGLLQILVLRTGCGSPIAWHFNDETWIVHSNIKDVLTNNLIFSSILGQIASNILEVGLDVSNQFLVIQVILGILQTVPEVFLKILKIRLDVIDIAMDILLEILNICLDI